MGKISKREWKYIVISGAFLGGVASGVLCWFLSSPGSLVSAFLGGGLGTALYGLALLILASTNIKLNELRESVVNQLKNNRIELRSMTNLRPLLSDDILLQYGGWSMGASLGETIARLVLRERPKLVVECGSGASTLLVASCLQRFGNNDQIIALDHEAKYAQKTRNLLREHGLQSGADVRTVPLESWQINGEDMPWYGVDLSSLPEEDIDMLIVDGPPGWNKPKARYPVVPVLKNHLSQECTIVVDDGDRPGERESAKRWANLLDCELKYEESPKGTWILHRNNQSS